MPGKKSTNEQIEERVEWTATMLAARRRKGDIKRAGMARYGVGWRTMEEYLARARKLLISWSQKSRAQHHNEAVQFYESILQSEAEAAVRMRAQERIDKLFGLEAPTRTESTTELRAKVTSVTQMSDEELDALIGDETAAGLPDGQPGAETPPGGEDIPAELHDVHKAGLSDGLAPSPDL